MGIAAKHTAFQLLATLSLTFVFACGEGMPDSEESNASGAVSNSADDADPAQELSVVESGLSGTLEYQYAQNKSYGAVNEWQALAGYGSVGFIANGDILTVRSNLSSPLTLANIWYTPTRHGICRDAYPWIRYNPSKSCNKDFNENQKMCYAMAVCNTRYFACNRWSHYKILTGFHCGYPR